VVFWEASNSGITAAHMRDMVEVRKTWDPHGGRFAGTRSTDQASMSVREYGSPMDVPARTALMPYWDAEYARAEAPRRIWDKYTPFLDYGGKFVTGGYLTVASPAHVAATKAKGGDGIYEYPQDAFRLNSSEDLALNNLMKYWDRYKTSAFVAPAQDRLTRGIMVGGAKIIFADSNSHGRMMDMEVSRVTGALDAVRLPKEAYHALTVAHGTQPAVHIIGHWNYLADTVKPMWIACNAEKVKLATYGEDGQLIKDYGWAVRDEVNAQYGKVNQYAFQVKNVAWQPGKIEAIAYNGDQEVARHAVETSGAPAALKLTPVMNPGPWHADGADIAIVDVEVMDAQGRRCPTDEARVDFASAGDAGAFLGGYNSGIRHSTNRPYLNIECGINRVFVRATRTAGDFTITVTRDGLKPSSLTLTSLAVASPNGLSTVWPRHFGYALGAEPTPAADNTPARVVRTPPSDAAPTDVMREFAYTGTNGPLLDPPMPAAHVEHSLRNGAQVYVDKAWTFDALPAYLLGGDYVQGFARDATETTSTDTIQFYTNRPCVLFMLVDEANKQPVHLNSVDFIWRKLPETVTVGGRKHAIYRSRALTAGHNGYFPSNGFGVDVAPGSNQYIMVAVPAP
jgi:beta-galactosidase